MVQSIAENLKVHTLSFRNCNVNIYDQANQPEWNAILAVLQLNCSLTTLNLDDNIHIDEDFELALSRDIEKNKKIVNTIFPKLME